MIYYRGVALSDDRPLTRSRPESAMEETQSIKSAKISLKRYTYIKYMYIHVIINYYCCIILFIMHVFIGNFQLLIPEDHRLPQLIRGYHIH